MGKVPAVMSDLVIGGGRRVKVQRPLRSAAIAVALVGTCILVAYFIYQRAVAYVHPGGNVPDAPLVMTEDRSPESGTRLTFGGASLSDAGEITVLRLVGDPHTLGASHGRLLGAAVSQVADGFSPTITHTVSRGGFFGRFTYGTRLRWGHRYIDDGIPGHQLLEIAGVLRGAKKSAGRAPGWESFVRQQAALDVGVPAPWSSGNALRAVARSMSFITTLRGTSGDRLLVGRSFSLPGAGDGGDAAAEAMTVSFIKADGVLPYASIGWPGLIGVVSGINSEGIAVMVHPVRTSDVRITRTAQPATLLARDILENARTLDDAIGVLNAANVLGSALFVIVDGNARQWAVVERSPESISIDRNPSPTAVTDILQAEAFDEDAENDRAKRTRPSAMRGARIKRLLKSEPPSTPDEAAALLRDTRSNSGAPLPAGHRGAVDDPSAVHTALFDASGMVLWVADSRGAGGRFRAFDLRYELRGEGTRPAPPADLPAAAEYDPARAAAVNAARGDLRAARRAWSSGKKRRARELVQRALAHAPNLPEALKLAGDLARKSKEIDEAMQYYQRYLDVGPDDMGAKQEVEALISNH